MSDEPNFDQDLVTLAFFVAKLQWDKDWEVEFGRFAIDGTEFHISRIGPLPGNQGFWGMLGMFEEGRTLELTYRLTTGFDVPDGQVVLGYFPDARLTRATRFTRLALESHRSYEGTVSITVQS